jgi:hypothetical protein
MVNIKYTPYSGIQATTQVENKGGDCHGKALLVVSIKVLLPLLEDEIHKSRRVGFFKKFKSINRC